MSAPFRLARLLALRRRLEDQRKLDLARELAEQARRLQALEEAREHLEEARDHLGTELEQGLAASRFRLLAGYIDRQELALGQRRRSVSELDPRLARARERLAAALRERRVLERLKEHWQERQDTEHKRAEQTGLDETGGRQWWRRTLGHGEHDAA